MITGSSTGIGAAAAKKLAGLGFTVLAGVRKQADGKVFDKFDNIIPITMDVTIAETLDSAVATTALKSKDLNLPVVGVICNAGVGGGPAVPVEFRSDAEDEDVFNVNYHGVAKTAKRFSPLLRQTKGSRLLIVGSIAGTIASPMGQPYSASKFAVRSLADSLRRELKPAGVSVSRIEPGFIQTPILNKSRPTGGDTGPFEKLEPSLRLPYEELWQRTRSMLLSMSSVASSTDDTDRDITAAMTSPRPQPVYHPGVVAGGQPAYLSSFVFNFLSCLGPSWVDFLVESL